MASRPLEWSGADGPRPPGRPRAVVVGVVALALVSGGSAA
jgi:hypothetical protein